MVKRSDNVFEDLKACLKADGYEPFTENDIINIIVRNCSEVIFPKTKTLDRVIMELLDGISKESSWKHGYYHKYNNLPFEKSSNEYDMKEAVIWYYLSNLAATTVDDLNGLKKPDESVLPFSSKDVKDKVKNGNFNWKD